jgi:hypothetical protein
VISAADPAARTIELKFRHFTPNDPGRPGPGELWIQPSDGFFASQSALATRVLDHGIDGFPHGELPIRAIFVSDDPTLDDMLAYSFARALARGATLSEGCRSFAKYAHLVRQGHQPSKPAELELHASLEGIFLAIRNASHPQRKVDRLTDPDVVSRFKADWERMEARIFKAMADAEDPFTVSMFAAGPDFAAERTFLANDKGIYRQDLERGEGWRIRISQGIGQAAGLLLRQPNSRLFKFWSRADERAPGAHGYLFLAVQWSPSEWVFSTDPAHRLSIKLLADLLQKKEMALDPERAKKDPWFNGARFDYTLVAAPHDGTLVPPGQVERLVKHWCHATVIWPKSHKKRNAAMLALAALLVGVLCFILIPPPRTPVPPFEVRVLVNGQVLPDKALQRQVSDDAKKCTVEFEPEFAKEDTGNEVVLRIPRPLSQPMKVVIELQSAGDLNKSEPAVLINSLDDNQARRLRDPVQDGDGQQAVSAEIPAFFRYAESYTAANTVSVHFKKLGTDRQKIRFRVSWEPNLEERRHLYLLSIGIAQYEERVDRDKHKKYSLSSLPGADDEARRLAHLLTAQVSERGAFDQVAKLDLEDAEDGAILVNSFATRDNFKRALSLLKAKVNDGSPSLVVITYSGHGQCENGKFYFLTYDKNPADAHVGTSSVSWTEVAEELRQIHCPVVVIVDACHSGGIQLRQVQAAVDDAGNTISALSEDGVVVIASCVSQEKAWSYEDWDNHSALMLAVLEVLQGEGMKHNGKPVPRPADLLLPQEQGREWITVKDLYDYAQRRVSNLAEMLHEEQNTVVYCSKGLRPDQIVLARFKK